MALLAFENNEHEVDGVAELVRQLVQLDEIPPHQILVLTRSDHNGAFTAPIKARLLALGIPIADPDVVKRSLAEPQNRSSMAYARLLVNREDSLAWATLLFLEDGVGDSFFDWIYERAIEQRISLGRVLLALYENGYEGGPASRRPAARLVQRVVEWLEAQQIPAERPNDGWGGWLSALPRERGFQGFSEELAQMLERIDALAEDDTELARYLNQIGPLGKDVAAAEGQGVRFMSMSASKGLTVQATIVAGCEEGIIPHARADAAEERRLLYVAMTRARQHLFCTWARRRQGPTARTGAERVGYRRTPSSFFTGGPVRTQDGAQFLRRRE